MRCSSTRIPLRGRRNARQCLMLAGLLVMPTVASGQASFEVVRSIVPEPGFPWGRILRAADGALYGTTYVGGPVAAGTVFRLDLLPGGGAARTIVHTFTGANGSHPVGDLIQASDGALYGTTCDGGAEDAGVIFKLTSTGAFTILHTFRPSLGEGACPWAGLVEARDGNFYGSTNGYLKEPGSRSLFKIAPDGTFTTLNSFVDPINSGGPWAALVQARDGHFYGTTEYSIFRITADGILTTLHSFPGCSIFSTEGCIPTGALVEAPSGELYGTTSSTWVVLNGGSAFKITTSGQFTLFGPTPAGSTGTLALGADGAFYGTSQDTVYRMTLSGEVTELHSFRASEERPFAGVVLAPNGNFYGTTVSGGARGAGSVFELTPSGDVTYLHTFENNGHIPIAGLTQGTDGNLYGTTLLGGLHDGGAIFRMSLASPVMTTLFSFGSDDMQATPGPGTVATLFEAADGHFYGVASPHPNRGGSHSFFRMSLVGDVVVVHSLSGVWPINTGFIQGRDGRFYGTSQNSPRGQVLSITTDGTLDEIHAFGFCASVASLVEGRDASFYGSTFNCEGGGGSLFRITAGLYTLLHAFGSFGDGQHPTGALIQGQDGNFYGTTRDGGLATATLPDGMGTVFRMTPEGTVTTLHRFGLAEGINPWAGLAEGEDGAFYGTTPKGGLGHGTVYRITATGEFSVVHAFTGVDGSEPYAPLTLASDGSLYGITPVGGTAGMGAIFRITPAVALPDRLRRNQK